MKKTKKKKNKKLLIILILILLIAGSGVFYYFNTRDVTPTVKRSIKVKTPWGKKYYEYLKKVKLTEDYESAGLNDLQDAKLYFIEAIDVTDPLMVISYQKDDKKGVNLYYIDGKNIETIKYESSEVKYIFTIATSNYEYFIKSIIGDTTSIIPIREQIDYHRNLSNDNDNFSSQIDAMKFTSQDQETVKDDDGKDVVLTRYEETFIDIDVNENKVDFDPFYSNDELKKSINKAVKKYKTNLELQTDNVKKTVKDEKERIRVLKNKIERLKSEKTNASKNQTTNQTKPSENVTKKNNTGTNKIQTNPNEQLLTKENADNIIKRFYGLNDDLQNEKDGIKVKFASLGLVTYKKDNEKYYYYSSYNIFDNHTSYNGSVMVSALTGKIKDIALISRDVPSDKQVPYSPEDKDIN